MTTTVNDKPTYHDKLPVFNKITIAPGEEREVTILLKPHVGREGRKKDGELIAFVAQLEGDLSEIELVQKFANDDEFIRMASIVLDLDDEEGQQIIENITLFDLVEAFKEAIPYRTQQVKRPEVEEALKKSKGGDNSVPTT